MLTCPKCKSNMIINIVYGLPGRSLRQRADKAKVSLGGCVNPVQDMTSIMAAIDEESFDDGKIIVAKQATSKKCLTVDQIKQIMDEFSFSKNKLNFAKYAYKRCYNPDDYYQVNGAFDFSSDKEEMNEFINDQN